MALVLSLQFYFNDKAQQDILNEIQHLSNSINIATNSYYQDVLKSIRENYPPPKSKLDHDSNSTTRVEGQDLFFELNDEIKRVQDLQRELNIEGGQGYERLIETHKDLRIRKDEIGKAHKELLEQLHNIEEKADVSSRQKISRIFPRGAFKVDSLLQEMNVKTDSENKVIVIDVDLNTPSKTPVSSNDLIWTQERSHKSPVDFTFQFPDFSIPDQPRFLKYNYSTADINAAFLDMRNKNVLITSGLFLLSILAFFFVSRRLTQPIRSLKGSFEKVVNGNLDIPVTSNSRDEIGDLTNSFNQMVVELQKNREREKILQRKERLASLGQLAAGVAHEIKNPLNAINLTIEHMRDKFLVGKDKQVKAYIETIQSEIRRLDKVVNNFLSFVRSENLQLAETDVNKLVNDVVHLLKREMKSLNINLKLDLAKAFTHSLDGERFKTVIMNVVLNAMQAMPDGGQISISTNADGKYVLIKDAGIGIPSKDLENIFDLFYTTKSSGTGLGLPTAYKIMKEHKGDIQISSVVGKGTEVRIQL
jgi:signal transduction histidine kinase